MPLVMRATKKLKAKKTPKVKKANVKAKSKAVPLRKKPAKAEEEPTIVDEGEEEAEDEHCGEEKAEEEEVPNPTRSQHNAFKLALAKAPPVIVDTVKKIKAMSLRTGKREQMAKMVLAYAKEKWDHKMLRAIEQLEVKKSQSKKQKALPKFLMMAKYGGMAMFREALKAGEIVEVENPDGGAPLYQVATFLTKEGTEYTKSVQCDKSKNKDGHDDDMFDELDIDFTM